MYKLSTDLTYKLSTDLTYKLSTDLTYKLSTDLTYKLSTDLTYKLNTDLICYYRTYERQVSKKVRSGNVYNNNISKLYCFFIAIDGLTFKLNEPGDNYVSQVLISYLSLY